MVMSVGLVIDIFDVEKFGDSVISKFYFGVYVYCMGKYW